MQELHFIILVVVVLVAVIIGLRVFKRRQDDDDIEVSKDIPSFSIWCQFQDEDLNLMEALDKYIAEYKIALRKDPDEHERTTRLRTEIKVIEESLNDFDPDARKDLESILFRFRSTLRMSETGDEMRKKQKDVEEKLRKVDSDTPDLNKT